MKFETASGSIYEIRGNLVRRVKTQPQAGLRADGEWVRSITKIEPVIGEPVSMIILLPELESAGVYTHRITTEVTRIWG